MLNTIVITLFCIMASFGAVSLICTAVLKLLRHPKGKNPMCHTAVLIKNPDNAEGYIRSVMWERGLSGFFEGERVVAVYCGKDEGLKILRALEKEYTGLTVMTPSHYIDYISRIYKEDT